MVSKLLRKKRLSTTITVVSTRGTDSSGYHGITPNTTSEGSNRSTARLKPAKPTIRSFDDAQLPTRPPDECIYKDDDIMEAPYSFSCFQDFVPSTITVFNDQDDVASELSIELIPDRVPTPRPKMERKTLKTLKKAHSAVISVRETDWPSDEEEVSIVGSPFRNVPSSFECHLEDSICGAWPCSPMRHEVRHEREPQTLCANPIAARDDTETRWAVSSPSMRDLSVSVSSF